MFTFLCPLPQPCCPGPGGCCNMLGAGTFISPRAQEMEMFRVVPLFTGCVGGSWRSSPGIASFPAMAVTLLAGGQIWPPPPPPQRCEAGNGGLRLCPALGCGGKCVPFPGLGPCGVAEPSFYGRDSAEQGPGSRPRGVNRDTAIVPVPAVGSFFFFVCVWGGWSPVGAPTLSRGAVLGLGSW